MNIEAFFKVTYGLFIVSSGNGDKRNGYIANTAFQVTSEPIQFGICCNKENYTAKLIAESGLFSISVLEQNASSELISLFGYKSGYDINKFENVEHFTGMTGVPVVTQDSIAWFECSVEKTFDVGTHLIFIGKALNYDLIDETKEPLTYAHYKEVRKGTAPKNAPTYIDKSKLKKEEKDKPKTVDSRKFECQICGYIYEAKDGDSEGGIASGTSFDDLPDDWVCPLCGAGKSEFEEVK